MSAWFEYHCYEGEDSSDAVLWHHTHQAVEIIRPLTDREAEEIPPMFRVRFRDGLEYDVFEDELVKSPEDFERPAWSRLQEDSDGV